MGTASLWKADCFEESIKYIFVDFLGGFENAMTTVADELRGFGVGNDTSFPRPVYPCKVPAKKPAGTGMQVRATCLGVGNRYLFKD